MSRGAGCSDQQEMVEADECRIDAKHKRGRLQGAKGSPPPQSGLEYAACHLHDWQRYPSRSHVGASIRLLRAYITKRFSAKSLIEPVPVANQIRIYW